MSGMLSIGGIVSGLQTDDILAKLEQIERAPITTMQATQARLQAKDTVWTSINMRLLSVKEKATALINARNLVTMTATSNESTVTTSASTGAMPGDYSFTVNTLAKYHQVGSKGFVDSNTTVIGGGNLKLTVNGKEETFDVTSMTLDQLAKAINDADLDANAMVVNDGTAYHLLVNATQLGSAGKITTTGSDAAALTALTFGELRAADDASISFGTLEVKRSSNTLTDVIPGLTINLKEGSTGKTVNIHVEESTEKVVSAVKDLVDQYNAFIEFAKSQQKFDEDTKESGILLGDSSLQRIENDLARSITDPIANPLGKYRTLVQLGVMSDGEGKLKFDETVLKDALKNNKEDVLTFFSQTGKSSSADVVFISASDDTRASSAAGYAVKLTQIAEKAAYQAPGDGGLGLPAALAQDETINVNGVSVALTQNMTPAEIVEAINQHESLTGVTASLTNDGAHDFLNLTQQSYGSAQKIRVFSSLDAIAGSTGIGKTIITQEGKDVQGTIGGITATGSGQMLTVTADGDAKGIQVKVTATALGTGDFGTIAFSQGMAHPVSKALDFLTNSSGMISSLQKTLMSTMDDIAQSIAARNEAVTRKMERMRAQFNAMEVALSKLQTQSSKISSFITQANANTSE